MIELAIIVNFKVLLTNDPLNDGIMGQWWKLVIIANSKGLLTCIQLFVDPLNQAQANHTC